MAKELFWKVNRGMLKDGEHGLEQKQAKPMEFLKPFLTIGETW